MSGPVPHRFSASMTAMALALDWLTRDCDAQGVAADDALRLTLVLEELYTNTVRHGHGGDCEEPVAIAWQLEPRHIVLHYADRAPPFDPRPRALAGPALDDAQAGDVGYRPVGGLGLLLVGQLCESVDYSRQDGWNILCLRLPRST